MSQYESVVNIVDKDILNITILIGCPDILDINYVKIYAISQTTTG